MVDARELLIDDESPDLLQGTGRKTKSRGIPRSVELCGGRSRTPYRAEMGGDVGASVTAELVDVEGGMGHALNQPVMSGQLHSPGESERDRWEPLQIRQPPWLCQHNTFTHL